VGDVDLFCNKNNQGKVAMILLYADGCTYWIHADAIYVPPFWRE